MPDIEHDATFARRGDFLAHRAVRRDRSIGKRPKAMGDDVPAPQPRQHLHPGRRRMVEMRHDRQPDLLGDLDGDVERGDP